MLGEMDRERKKNKGAEREAKPSAMSKLPVASSREKLAVGPSRTYTTDVTSNDLKVPTISVDVPSRATSLQASPSRSPRTPEVPKLPGVGSGKEIPARNSSLRHSSPGKSQRKRKPKVDAVTPTKEAREMFTRSLSNLSVPSIPITEPVKDVVMDDEEDDEVTRRIKELKAQKELRDRALVEEKDQAYQHESANEESFPRRATKSLPAMSIPPTAAQGLESTRRSSKSKSPHRALTPVDSNATKSRVVVEESGLKRKTPVTQPNTVSRNPSAAAYQKHQRINSNPPAVTPAASRRVSIDQTSLADSLDDAVEDYVTAPRLSQKVQESTTGRTITFSEVGDPDGHVVFCCVGMGLTRYLTAFYDELAATLGLRLITPDRPGVGESEAHADGSGTPLGWPDDIRTICGHLGIARFSVLAHSAGAIYALATALRMPQHIRGNIHLMAPWIPPSQMVTIGINQDVTPPAPLPYSQRFLRSIPTPFLRAANSSLFSMTSTSITTSLPKSPRRTKRRSLNQDTFTSPSTNNNNTDNGVSTTAKANAGTRPISISNPSFDVSAITGMTSPEPMTLQAQDQNKAQQTESSTAPPLSTDPALLSKARTTAYDTRLTSRIWTLATTNANPAVDLLVCLERRQAIGFRYVDITKSCIIHQGSKDTRVPVENVKWLAKMMRRCEVRVLEGEGHGLMASAKVMAEILTEIAGEWKAWEDLTTGRGQRQKGMGVWEREIGVTTVEEQDAQAARGIGLAR